MTRKTELLLLLLIDFIMVNSAFVAYYWLRIRSGLMEYPIEPEFLLPMLAAYAFWLGLFSLFGMYQPWYGGSRIDEIILLFRASLVGVLALFFLIFVDDESVGAQSSSRAYILVYGGTLLAAVSLGRLSIRYLQRRLLLSGVGAQRTVIVGLKKQALHLFEMAKNFPALGYQIVGFISTESRSGKSRPPKAMTAAVLGSLKDLPDILDRHRIQQVLIGLDSAQHDQLLDVISLCNGHNVGMKILPDMYDIVSGQARINSIFGQALMDVRPQIMKPWEETAKRMLDILISLIVLVFSFPVLLLIGIAVKFNSPGPAVYWQERVGKNGRKFNILKLRSMRLDAEKDSGPTWAEKDDPRVTAVGRFLRRTHLDELPQFYNVLVGDMSLVGPRPERKYFSDQFAKEIPLYRHRLRVRPGITGWAQIKYRYDQSIGDVKSKLRHDLFYIENMSWRLDLKILLNTLYVMLRGKGHT